MSASRVLVVEDDKNLNNILQFRLEKQGYRVRTTFSGEDAVSLVQEQEFDIVLLDLGLPGRGGMEIMNDLLEYAPRSQVIIVTADARIDMAIAALRKGALDYITKPIDFDELQHALNKAIEMRRSTRCRLAVQRLAESRVVFPKIVDESSAMKEVMRVVDRVAASHAPILLVGESGTGKELIARAIHLRSPRDKAAFLPINCASLSHTLLESELFGHEQGAFTGAQETRRGLFEAAHMGTLFMDEIGEMSVEAQTSLLRVLESGEVRRVGGRTTIYCDVRIVAATNRDLSAAIQQDRFRKDLFYRLNSVVVTIPSLRARKEDIWPLACHFLDVLSKETAHPRMFAEEEVRPVFEAYAWPGNVRELRNTVERLSLLTEGEVIRVSDLPFDLLHSFPASPGVNLLSIEEVTKHHILRVLAMNHGNRREAARILEISEPTLYRKLREYAIPSDDNEPIKS